MKHKKLHTIQTNEAWIPSGFTLESHTDMGELDISNLKIDLYRSEKQKINYINGEDLLKEVKHPLNSAVLKYLYEHQDLIPESWKEKTNGYTTYLDFFGTILRSSRGNRDVLYLYWGGTEWYWDVHWLDRDWIARRVSPILASLDLGTSDTENFSDPLNLALRIKNLEDKFEKLSNALTGGR